MTTKDGQTGGELFIVDNSDKDWKVRRYLHEWAEISNSFDIATGCFEIGSLLALDGQWQKLDKIRILMGSETTYRTRVALLEALKTAVKKDLDFSVEKEKDKNDFLTGVPAILDALRSRKIECRVYTAKKFHAKAYITHARLAVVGSAALVGSSNFTQPGLEDNVELNVQVRREVEVLQQWFEQHWTDAEEVTAELVDVIDRHVRAHSPFLIYAKALQEYFKGHEMTVGEWEQNSSKVYRVLDQYQKEGYQALMKIAGQFRGHLLIKSRCLDAHRVGARMQLWKCETPRFVRLDLTFEPGSSVRDGHRGPSHCSTAGVRHLPRDGAGRLPLSPQLDGTHGSGERHAEDSRKPYDRYCALHVLI